jgi:Alanine dehydrogenase/PNT, N-terminal domain
MTLGVVRETTPGERRVALIPKAVPGLLRLGANVVVESGAGEGALLPDELYTEARATFCGPRRSKPEFTPSTRTNRSGLRLSQPYPGRRRGSSDMGVSDHQVPLALPTPTPDDGLEDVEHLLVRGQRPQVIGYNAFQCVGAGAHR